MGRSELRITRVENLCRRHREQVGSRDVGDVGSTSRKRWRGDVDIGLMMLMIRSAFFDSTKIPMLALVEVGSVFELCFFLKVHPREGRMSHENYRSFSLGLM